MTFASKLTKIWGQIAIMWGKVSRPQQSGNCIHVSCRMSADDAWEQDEADDTRRRAGRQRGGRGKW